MDCVVHGVKKSCTLLNYCHFTSPAPVFWPREFHGLYSQWGHKESDRTGRLSLSGFIKAGKSCVTASGVSVWTRAQTVHPPRGWDFKDCSSEVPSYNPRTEANWYHHQSVTKLQAWFPVNAICFVVWNLKCCSTWVLVGQAPSRGLTTSKFLPHLLYGAANLLTADSHSESLPLRAVSRQIRAKVRGLLCFVSDV